MGRFDFKEMMMLLVITIGALWLLEAVGLLSVILGFFASKIPYGGTQIGTIEGIIFPPLGGLIATIVTAFLVTLISTAIVIGLKDKKVWTTYLILSIVVAALWIIFPQVLPGLLQGAAGSAQSVFTGQLPMSIYMP